MKKLLVVDDEKDMLELVRYKFEQEGFSVVATESGERAVELAKKEAPSAVLLDIMMPGLDGLEVLKRLRGDQRTEAIPIIFLTAKAGEADRVVGLELGADDYVVKPFSPRELVARVKAVLRRTERKQEQPTVTTAGPIRMDASRREARVGDDVVPLTTTEFDLLRLLANNPGRVYTRPELMERTRGPDTVTTERAVDAHIAAIRRKLGDKAGEWVETVRGYGYRFRDEG
ncbi:MAG TPA: response regulator transcription factor [Planctomycetota bacterium]|nr:response regulator transcription factor [Planctomycetota bacterium]